VQLEADKAHRGSRIDLSNLNQTSMMVKQQQQLKSSGTSRVRSTAIYTDSQGNNIPLSPVSSNTSTSSDEIDHRKNSPMSPSGMD
jgi:hypothetical protein